MPRESSSRPGPIVVVAHRIPASVTPLGDWFAEIAHRVVLVTTAACEPGYRGRFAEIVVVEDYSHGPEVPDTLDRLCREHRVQSIVCGTEDDIARVARIRERHGIAGMQPDDAYCFTDKLVMKQAVAAHVPTPLFIGTVNAAAALAEHVAATGWPVVIKPRRSYGSRGVRVVHDLATLSAEAATRPVDDSIVEEFVPAVMHHVDGFARDGEVLVACPSRYVNDCLSFQESTPLGSVQLDADDPVRNELVQFTRDVVAALPATGLTPFHLEVFRSHDSGKLVFCEIACRLGGGHILEAMTYRLGFHPVEIWYRSQAGLPVSDVTFALSGDPRGFLLVPPRPGTLRAVATPVLPDSVTDFFVETAVPAHFDGASASTDTVLAFVVRGSDAAQVEDALRTCTSIAHDITTWES